MFNPSVENIQTLQIMSSNLESDENMAKALACTVEDLHEEIGKNDLVRAFYEKGKEDFLKYIKRHTTKGVEFEDLKEKIPFVPQVWDRAMARFPEKVREVYEDKKNLEEAQMQERIYEDSMAAMRDQGNKRVQYRAFQIMMNRLFGPAPKKSRRRRHKS